MATNDALLKIRALQEATGARLMAFAEAQNLPTESPLGPDWAWMPQDHRVRLLCHDSVRIESLLIRYFHTIWRVEAPLPHLLMTVHFPSLLYREKDDIRLEARLAAEDLRAAEAEDGHERSIVVGDFNLDPFDLGLVQADAFHAVSCRRQAQKNTG